MNRRAIPLGREESALLILCSFIEKTLLLYRKVIPSVVNMHKKTLTFFVNVVIMYKVDEYRWIVTVWQAKPNQSRFVKKLDGLAFFILEDVWSVYEYFKSNK